MRERDEHLRHKNDFSSWTNPPIDISFRPTRWIDLDIKSPCENEPEIDFRAGSFKPFSEKKDENLMERERDSPGFMSP